MNRSFAPPPPLSEEDRTYIESSSGGPFASAPANPPARSFGADDGGALRTRFEFTLPRGYLDRSGRLHREGVMRMATARDELLPLHDDRVRENPPYLTVVLLARVIERIGDVTDIHADVIENLFAADLAFLQDLYRRINAEGHTKASVNCPSCGHGFTVNLAGGRPGE